MFNLPQTRAAGYGVELVIGDPFEADFSGNDYCGVLLQYPNTYGHIHTYGTQILYSFAPLDGAIQTNSLTPKYSGDDARTFCLLLTFTQMTWWKLPMPVVPS